ncbi:MAG: DNA gyrase C-terminal beta-propeller domain-containing protein [Candidatus Promineifilaceae bacterium]
MERPDLSHVNEEVAAYIKYLEKQLLNKAGTSAASRVSAELEPSEPPTTINIITVTEAGLAKRTARHLYSRQRRAGMGVFDIESTENEPPYLVCEADAADDLIAVSNQGRIFRFAVSAIVATSVRGEGEPINHLLKMQPSEYIAALLRADQGLYINLLSERGWVRHVRKTYLGGGMIQGIRYHKTSQGGEIVSACWSNGEDDIFVATESGLGIRFSERQVPTSGCLGMRIDVDDKALAITATRADGSVVAIGHDGKGTVRVMSGFRKNKAPGAGGKVLLKTTKLAGVQAVVPGKDLFIISKLSKMIRFSADEIPPKTGVVQGVNCMTLRSDEVATLFVSG